MPDIDCCQDVPAFASLDDLNDWLEARCQVWREVLRAGSLI